MIALSDMLTNIEFIVEEIGLQAVIDSDLQLYRVQISLLGCETSIKSERHD
jgi:hypothetical protein